MAQALISGSDRDRCATEKAVQVSGQAGRRGGGGGRCGLYCYIADWTVPSHPPWEAALQGRLDPPYRQGAGVSGLPRLGEESSAH